MEKNLIKNYISADKLKIKYKISDRTLNYYLEQKLLQPSKIVDGQMYFTKYNAEKFVTKYLRSPDEDTSKKDVIYIRVSRESIMKDKEDGGNIEAQSNYSHELVDTYIQYIINELDVRKLPSIHRIYVDYAYNDNVNKSQFLDLLDEVKAGRIRRIYVPNDYLFGFNALDDIEKLFNLLGVEIVVLDIRNTVLEDCRTIVARLETRNFWKCLLHFILVEGQTRNWINEYGRRLAVDSFLSKYYNIENVKLKNQIIKKVKRGERTINDASQWKNYYK